MEAQSSSGLVIGAGFGLVLDAALGGLGLGLIFGAGVGLILSPALPSHSGDAKSHDLPFPGANGS